jgi:uroporphyrinogen decarboxylase
MISAEHFQRFSLPYLQKIVRSLKVPVILHICGDTTLTLEKMAESGAKALSVGKVDLAAAKKRVGGKVCLMGNVPTIEILLRGTAKQVRGASKECIRNAGEGGGFILSSECDIPADTPSDNITAMVKAARTYGKYPPNLL